MGLPVAPFPAPLAREQHCSLVMEETVAAQPLEAFIPSISGARHQLSDGAFASSPIVGDSLFVENIRFALSEFRPKRFCRRCLESRIGSGECGFVQACTSAHSVSFTLKIRNDRSI